MSFVIVFADKVVDLDFDLMLNFLSEYALFSPVKSVVGLVIDLRFLHGSQAVLGGDI